MPQKPGVYRFLNSHNEVLYVGKANQLKDRVSSYFRNSENLSEKTILLVSQIEKIEITIVESGLEALLLEANLIKKYSPKFNSRLRDGKNYLLIRITQKTAYPAVVTARKMDDKNSLYFGPYPSSTAVRHVLKLLRRIFPFQSTLNHSKRICLYYHLGLCPCLSAHDSQENRKNYTKTIRYIVDFLQGKTKKILLNLEKERAKASKAEFYEEAARIQKQIDAIHYVCQPIRPAFEYEVNPNLRSDLRMQEMLELQNVLQKNGIAIALPERIECYDNSNVAGTHPVSSMVVLTNGEIDKSQYRKFSIKTVKGPDDFETMKEVLTRRLHHREWPLPQLIVVDGGKGQVSAAKEVLLRHPELACPEPAEWDSGSQWDSGSKAGMTSILPLIGLAKREETIVTSDLREIHLSRSSKALQLIMRARDEAHRFAVAYHKKLRSKSVFLSNYFRMIV